MDRRGFTLIELMIVVVIIGILAAVAIPRFALASWRTKEKEAEVALKNLFTMQSVYRAERGGFASTVAELRSVGYEPAVLQYFEPIADSHLVSNACLNPIDADLSGKRVDFTNGVISDC